MCRALEVVSFFSNAFLRQSSQIVVNYLCRTQHCVFVFFFPTYAMPFFLCVHMSSKARNLGSHKVTLAAGDVDLQHFRSFGIGELVIQTAPNPLVVSHEKSFSVRPHAHRRQLDGNRSPKTGSRTRFIFSGIFTGVAQAQSIQFPCVACPHLYFLKRYMFCPHGSPSSPYHPVFPDVFSSLICQHSIELRVYVYIRPAYR